MEATKVSFDKGMTRKGWGVCALECAILPSHYKKNEIFTFVAPWIDLEGIMRSEISK